MRFLNNSCLNKGEKVMSFTYFDSRQVFDGLWKIFEHPEFPFKKIESASTTGRNFPAYNIIELDKNGDSARLELAVAGYTTDQLTVEREGNILIIKGQPKKIQDISKEKYSYKEGDEFIRHHGITSSSWCRTFELGQNTKVGDVSLKDGILSVIIQGVYPTANKTSFPIKTGSFDLK